MFLFYGKFSMAEHIGTHIDSPQHLVASEAVSKKNDPIDKVLNLCSNAAGHEFHPYATKTYYQVPIHKLVGEPVLWTFRNTAKQIPIIN